jgi:hypothetical protein
VQVTSCLVCCACLSPASPRACRARVALTARRALGRAAAIVRTKPQYAKGFYNSDATVPSGVERAMLPHKLATCQRDLCARDMLRRLLPAHHLSLQAAAGGGEGGAGITSDRLAAAAAAALFRQKVATCVGGWRLHSWLLWRLHSWLLWRLPGRSLRLPQFLNALWSLLLAPICGWDA